MGNRAIEVKLSGISADETLGMRSGFTIGAKLLAAVGAMIALTIVLGYSGLKSIGAFKAQFDNALDVSARKLVLADAIIAANSEMISAQRGMILAAFAKDAPDLENYKQLFRENTSLLLTSLDKMRPLLKTDEGKQLNKELAATVADWLPRFDDLARSCDSGDITEANRIREEIAAPIYKKIEVTARRISAREYEFLNQDKAAATAQEARSRWITFILLGLGVVVGGCAAMLVGNISRNLRRAVTELYRGAEEVSSAASQVASSSQSTANAAVTQAASLEETSASSEEIRAMATQNTDTTRSASGLATASQQRFVDANSVLDQMVVAMSEINASSGKISHIIKVIDEIAFQTNILALNAAVEAARAGEAGLSFAVVADEVRNLALRCAQAARDTTALIEDSVTRSADGKAKVDQVAGFIRAITGESNKVKTLLDEVNLGSQEQVRGIEQIARAIGQMERLTQSTAANAQQSAAAAEELTAQSHAVRRVVGQLAAMVGSAGP